MSEYIRILTRRSQRWSTTDGTYKKTNKLKRFVRKGIPINRRREVWMRISGAYSLKQNSPSYHDLRSRICNQAIIEIIEIDIPRTFPGIVCAKNDSGLL